jgi:glycosyltransferase involved in cell wall biosynthesis
MCNVGIGGHKVILSMRIGTILNPYGEKNPSGLGKCIFQTVKNIVEVCSQHEYFVYLKKAPVQIPDITGTNWCFDALETNNIYFYSGKKMDKKLDLYLFFNPVIPLFFRPKKSVVVVYDNSYMEMPITSYRQWLKKWFMFTFHYISLRRADGIIAVSEDTAFTTEKYFGIKRSDIKIVYTGFIKPVVEQEVFEIPEQFIIFAGVLKERKNPAGAIKGFATIVKDFPNCKLLIAGKKNDYYNSTLQPLVEELNLGDKIIFLDYVSNEKLSYLFSKARALIFPSLFDGFGMPILEAFNSGLPVIASNYGGPREAAGDCGVLIDPTNPEDIGRGMKEILTNDSLRQKLIVGGYERVKTFSWENTAKGIIKVCKEVNER